MSDYCTATELKGRLFAEGQEGSVVDDDRMAEAIAAASRWIDQQCGRRFYAATETRYYTADDSQGIEVDDLLSVTSLTCDEDGDRSYEITWASDDFDLLPYNAPLDGRPFTRIETAPEGDHSFPRGVRKGVKIVGSWGFAATPPAPVKKTCMILAARLYKRDDAPFGVIGSPETGLVKLSEKIDADVDQLLRPFIKWVF